MTIAFGSAGTLPTPGATTVAVPYPTGISAGDLLLLVAVNKYSAYTSAPPTGFTLLLERVGGSGGTGADAGNVRTAVWTRVADGTETGTVNVTKATETGSVIMPRMFRYTRTAGYGWSILADSGTSSSGGTSWSIASSNSIYIAAGDIVIAVSGVNTDAASFASQSVSATGCTFSAAVERQDSGTTTGHDVRLVVTEHACTAGSTESPAGYTATGSTGTPDGSTIILRLREALGVVAEQGAHTLSGQDSTLNRGYRFTDTGPVSGPPTHAITGFDVTFSITAATERAWFQNAWASGAWATNTWFQGGESFAAEQGSYTLSGQSANLLATRTIAAEQGSYALTGQDATLRTGKKITAESGSYALTGQSANFVHDWRLTADQGTYTLTGRDVLMYLGGAIGKAWADEAWYSGAWGGTVWAEETVPGAYVLTAGTGQYSLLQSTTSKAWSENSWYSGAWRNTAWQSGLIETGLYRGYTLTAETGYYTYTGDDALRDMLFHADQGSYTLTGQDASFNSGLFITAATGSYALTGRPANLLKGYRLTAVFGGYATSGSDVEFVVGVGEHADTGYYTLTGFDATLSRTYVLQAETGSYALTGQNANLVQGGIFDADAGTYVLTGQDATLTYNRGIAAETGYYRIGGQVTSGVPARPYPPPAGGVSKKTRKKKQRVTVEIDGETFEVNTEEEAKALLQEVSELAQQTAKAAAAAAIDRFGSKSRADQLDSNPDRLNTPEVTAGEGDKSENLALRVQAELDKAYHDAQLELERAIQRKKQQILDEEESLVLMLLD